MGEAKCGWQVMWEMPTGSRILPVKSHCFMNERQDPHSSLTVTLGLI